MIRESSVRHLAIPFYDKTSMLMVNTGGVVVTGDFLEVHGLVGPTKTSTLSTVTAIYDIGCFFGAVMAFTLGERLGRKKAIMLGTTIMAVGTILQMTSYSLPQIIVGRIVLGAGNGLNTSTAPIWQTETASPQWRGKLVILDMMMNIAGYALVNWINYGLSFHGGAIAWRFPIAFQFIFFFILWGTVPWLPESPRWLMAHQQEAKALEVLSCLEAKPVDHPYITTMRNEIEFSVRYERENSLRWRDLLSRKKSQHDTKTVRRLLLGAANRNLEDMDAYYRSNPALIVTKDLDAISTKRPLKYIQHEDEEIQISKMSRSTKVEDLEVEHVE
ncbi:hypothetical protein APSETT445_001131 [Aspergillus pseudonomiae]